LTDSRITAHHREVEILPAPIPVLLMARQLTIGGCERDLAKLAMNLDRSQFLPYVGCFHPDGYRAEELRAAGIPIITFPVRSFYSASALAGANTMRRFLREHRIQVVHPFDVPTDMFAVPVARLCGVPAVISCQLSFRDMSPPIHRRLLRWTDPFAHRIVVNSNAVRDHLIADEGIRPGSIFVCHNGVETRMYFPAPPERPAALKGASLVVGSLCVLREEKRLDLLVSAFAQIKMLLANLKLLIVGSGPMLEALQKQSRDLGIAADCVFEPAQSDVVPWLRNIDIFVTPSFSESFPNALLEAMACGCAPIGSSVGGIPELIEHGQNGFVFKTGDVADLTGCLRQLITSSDLRDRFRAAAARTAETRFSMSIHVRKIQSLYRELLGLDQPIGSGKI
jgi:glycosyltransferase involved in cell wall biosynthesis